ncbi:MRG/MORF4L-binding protein [Anopheles ziemanni]|uniref:MRG/MORF4L-binding protein n=1 Tax=Anopheles coustani TaxID=139045 RepID=UPI00265A2D0E|nr:MRG/MORF4L-binding protein [Anopheles coustani]XP_058173226.1 MRG/MORF4L-binding protein [Anopheles ziemanni]
MATVGSRDKLDCEQFEWTAEEEIQLFLAMDGMKPVGINRHFYMACIIDRLSKALQRDIASEAVWAHLGTIYNLRALDEQEFVPFLNEECDFGLPEADFGVAIGKRKPEDTERSSIPVASEPESKKPEVKLEPAVAKTPATKTPVPSKDGKEVEKEEKDARDRDPTSVKVKTKTHDGNGVTEGGPKRSQKRTRGSMTFEPSHSNNSSPANTPPNGPKRRRI